MRDTLGVKVDFSDEAEEREKDGGKKKKATQQKSKVKVRRCTDVHVGHVITVSTDHWSQGKRGRSEEAYFDTGRETGE